MRSILSKMCDANKLKLLIDFVGNDNNFCYDVPDSPVIDAKVLKELNDFLNSRTTDDIVTIQRHLQGNQFPQLSADESFNWTYAANVFGILFLICEELDKNDELPISINEVKKIHKGIRKTIEFGLKPFLLGDINQIKARYMHHIIASTNALLKITGNKFFPLICTQNEQHLVYTDIMCSIFMISCYADYLTKPKLEDDVRYIRSKLSSAEYFKILFLIKGSKSNRSDLLMQQTVHKELMQSLYKPGSFFALCEALLPSITSLDQDEEIIKKRLHCCTVISSIIAKRGHKGLFYHQIIDEIHQHLLSYVRSSKSHQLYFTDVGVQCLRKLCLLQKADIDRHITDLLFGVFKKLAVPGDLIAGAVVCEPNEFLEAVHMVHLTFCASGPSDYTLPSALLKILMPLLVQLHHTISDSTNKLLKAEILAIIVRCLSNREKNELNKITEWILYEEYNEGAKYLNPRIQVERMTAGESESITFKIGTFEECQQFGGRDLDLDLFLRSSTALVQVLKQCNHNVLIYNIFLHLLEMFSNSSTTSIEAHQSSSSSELLSDESELQKSIEIKFKRKYAVIHALNELILFKMFHGQFAENPHDIISVLERILSQQIEQIESVSTSKRHLVADNYEEILIVILSIVGHLKLYIQTDEFKGLLYQTLKRLRTLIINIDGMKNILKKLDTVIDSDTKLVECSAFQEAKAIISEIHSEPYTKVYGIMNMIKLINSRDEETCLNSHVVLALALKLLREEDSYIFLNCIKLLVALFDILEDTVLDALISEYHFDIDAHSAEIDFKLKVGEAIVKVTQEIGEMCYKHKAILMNCFLRGCYNEHDEFRTSNMSNLGVIMRILSYQVHHIFQEVMLLIQDILQNDEYLPTRRAAALILSDLLKGISNLGEFQEFLLPIYRTLKYIERDDSDLHIQIHARNALASLNEKIKEELFRENKLEKEICLLNVKKNENSIRYK